jgi:hypothetical protein
MRKKMRKMSYTTARSKTTNAEEATRVSFPTLKGVVHALDLEDTAARARTYMTEGKKMNKVRSLVRLPDL